MQTQPAMPMPATTRAKVPFKASHWSDRMRLPHCGLVHAARQMQPPSPVHTAGPDAMYPTLSYSDSHLARHAVQAVSSTVQYESVAAR